MEQKQNVELGSGQTRVLTQEELVAALTPEELMATAAKLEQDQKIMAEAEKQLRTVKLTRLPSPQAPAPPPKPQPQLPEEARSEHIAREVCAHLGHDIRSIMVRRYVPAVNNILEGPEVMCGRCGFSIVDIRGL